MSNINTYQDSTLAYRIKRLGCSDSLRELSNRHEKLVYKFFHKYLKKNNSSFINFPSAETEKDFVIFKSAISFKQRKKRGSKFSTWLANQTRYHCLNIITKNSKLIPTEEKTIDFFNNQNPTNYIVTSNEVKDLNETLKLLDDERINQIFYYRHFAKEQLKWKQIARKLDMSVTGCINLYNKGKVLLKKEYEYDRET